MYRLTSYLVLMLLSLVFFACGDGKKETDNSQNTDTTADGKPKSSPAEIPKEGDYVFGNFGGIEKVFAVKPQIGAVNHTEEFGPQNNMLRIERLVAADKQDEKFVIELFNFPLRGMKAPMKFVATDPKSRIDVRYIFVTPSGQKDFYKSMEGFEVNVEKIEGDGFEGTFTGPMSFSTEVVKATGKFRITMVDPINNAKQPA